MIKDIFFYSNCLIFYCAWTNFIEQLAQIIIARPFYYLKKSIFLSLLEILPAFDFLMVKEGKYSQGISNAHFGF